MIKAIILVLILVSLGCTSFNLNESGLRRACKSKVSKYDDGTLTFECKDDAKN